MAQPSVGPDSARREPVCAAANANTEFSTKATRIRRRGASVVMRHRRRKTASSRVSGLLRTQRRCRRAFSLPPVRTWARQTAQTRSSGIFLENPAVFCYFWNETAGAETAGLSPAAAPGPVSRCPGHADTSWVCAQAVKTAQTAAFSMPNSVFCRHISAVFGVRRWRTPAGGRLLPNERAILGWAGGRRCPCGLKHVALRLKLTAIKPRNLPLWPKPPVATPLNPR